LHYFHALEDDALKVTVGLSMKDQQASPPLFQRTPDAIAAELGKDNLLEMFRQMLTIRQFEMRAETGYQQGKIGGFLHLYIGQEAIQTAAVKAIGLENWWTTTYRCHALALLLGETPHSLLAELYGRSTGNAGGRGGSMHFFGRRMLGGLAIVGGGIPIATGAALSCKYLKKNDEISVSFFGDGAVPQGVFHESLNIASMWSLPCLYVIENNKWSMGTPLCRTLVNYNRFLEDIAKSYDMQYLRLDGMDMLQCYAGFKEAHRHIISERRPVLIECLTDRFRGHSISDPGLYRSKDEVKASMERDPLLLMKEYLLAQNLLSDEEFKQMEQECREEIAAAAAAAEADPWPDTRELEEDVYGPTMEIS
jgi:pyruvate dehydrogenase E1 component alpha subunit